MRTEHAVLLVAALAAAQPLAAQHLPPQIVAAEMAPFAQTAPGFVPQETDDPWGAIGGGLFGGFLGFWIGGFTGIALFNCRGEWCEWGLFAYGAMAGEVLGMAAVTHLENGRRGNVAIDLLTAGLVGAAGLAVWGEGGKSFFNLSLAEVGVTFVAQLATTVLAERAIGR